jgi:hypothetical protein
MASQRLESGQQMMLASFHYGPSTKRRDRQGWLRNGMGLEQGIRPKMRHRCRRAGVDSIIATVLIVAVTLVASLAVSGFVFGVIGGAQNPVRIAVTGTSLFGSDFWAGGTTSTFTCAAASSGSYLTLTNTGTGSAAVSSVSITWAGGNSAFNPTGACSVGASNTAGETMYVVFPANTRITTSATVGQAYAGTVTLSDGAQLLFRGIWQ